MTGGLTRFAAVLLVLVAALFQVSVVYRIEVVGASPNVLVLVMASIALLSGSVGGACTGFTAGIALAVFGGLPIGPHALVATLAGYTIGRVGELLVTDDHPAPPLVAGIFATVFLQVGFPLVEFLVDPAGRDLAGVWQRAVVMTALSAVLAVPVYLLVRRVLAAAAAAGPLTRTKPAAGSSSEVPA